MPERTEQQVNTQPETIGKSDIQRSALEAWRKLDAVIQKELSSIIEGEKEITASTAGAIIKFIEASASLANGPDVSEKDRVERDMALRSRLSMPVFDD